MTDLDEEQEIVCVVDAYPPAQVTWKKDGSVLDTNDEYVIGNVRGRSSLTILGVGVNHIGQYECTATNTLGENTATAAVSGHASPAVFISDHEGDDPYQYTVEWTVHSKSIIEQFEVKSRKKGDSKWSNINHVNVVTNNNDTTDDNDNDYHEKLLLKDLKAGTTYEVTVASKNKFGLSSPSDIFSFSTKSLGTLTV